MPKIRLLHVWVIQGVGNSKKWLLLVLGRERVLSGSMSRQEFLCRDMVSYFKP